MPQSRPLLSALSLAFELGYTIAIPLVVFALVGRLIDKRFDTSPWFLLTGIIISIIISTWAVYIKTMKILAEIEREAQQNKEKKNGT